MAVRRFAINSNIIKLNQKKSSIKDRILFIQNRSYDYGDIIQNFKTQKEYEEANSNIELAQTHFDGKIAYIEYIHTLVIAGEIDNLLEQLVTYDWDNGTADESNINGDFITFIEKIAEVSIEPFRLATVCWEEVGIGVYYIKYDKDFQSIRLDFDSWEGTDLFNEITKEFGFDADSDDFYEDDENHEEMRSPFFQVCMELYNHHLLSDPELLAPDWYNS